MRVFLLAVFSGFLSYLSVSFPRFVSTGRSVSDDDLFILPGVLFCLFILLPQVQKTRYRVMRWIGLMVFSVAAWYAAVMVGFKVLPLALQSSVLSCGVSGSVGAIVLAMAGRYLVPLEINLSSLLKGVLAGFLGGCIFGLAIVQPRASLAGEVLYLTGFLFWQSSVAMSMFQGQKQEVT